MKTCVYCGKELTGKQLKYCDNDGLCKFRYNSIKNDKAKPCSHAQQFCNNKDQWLNLEIRMFTFWEQCPTCEKNINKKIKQCPTATEVYKYFLNN